MPSNLVIAKAIVNKVARQAPATPEAALMVGIFEQAMKDAYTALPKMSKNVVYTDKTRRNREALIRAKKYIRDDAMLYLASDIPCLEIIGIDSVWVRRLLKQAGLSVPRK